MIAHIADVFSIRQMVASDIPLLMDMTAIGGHFIEPDYFETALKEQEDGKRIVLLACDGAKLVGYVHLNFFPQYAPFLRLSIPEIQDLFVHPDARRQGIGQSLVRACEDVAKERGATDIGIGVGVSGQFGTAQRLYAQLGYIPDGAGAVFERIPISTGDVRPIDNRVCLMLMKPLS